jgi:hypothetical protein
LASTERAVVTGPFRPNVSSIVGGEFSLSPKPPWFITAKSATTTARRLTDYGAQPSWWKLRGIWAAAIQG